ncbi:DUF6712 family protein [Bernardetia sp. Wsw4-3y2]|uniref:DUF6712 family protein n=1 Tax=Bernardetia sp. Wsw4-3y2 TaxID=3127471 RepID=UPI0030D12ABA
MKLLFKNIEEVQEYISVNISCDFLNIKESLRVVTRKHLFRAISKKQYKDLIKKLEAEKLKELDIELLDHCKRIVANFAFAHKLPELQVQISDAGIHIVSTENKKTAFPWQIQNLQRHYTKNAYDAIEECLEFLTENFKNFPIWHQSEAFTEATECLINNAKTFNEYVFIHENRLLFTELKPHLKRIQRTRIFTQCEKLFEKILLQTQKNDVSEKNIEVLEKARTALAKLTMSEFMKVKTIIIDEDGITTTATNNTQTINGKIASEPNIYAQARMSYEEQGDLELQELVYYLKENRRSFVEVEEQYPEEPKKIECCEKCHRHKTVCDCQKDRKILFL